MDDLFARYQEALRRGHQLAAEGRFKEALTDYQAAAGLAGERALPHVCVGGMNLRLGKANDALAAYDRALTYEPADLSALSGRAAALLATGRRAEAAEVQARMAAIRTATASPAATAPPGGTDGAATPLTRSDTLMLGGEQARLSGDMKSAIEAWLLEAREHALEQHFDAALEAGLRALALDSGALATHLELTRLYLERGWTERAAERVALIRRLLVLTPDDAAQLGLAELLEAYPSAAETEPQDG